VFVLLRRAPGHAQVDFGEALAEMAGDECKIHLFAMGLPHTDAYSLPRIDPKMPRRFPR